jgi:hypothetical protein
MVLNFLLVRILVRMIGILAWGLRRPDLVLAVGEKRECVLALAL